MADELPPYDTSPENLLELSQILREGGLEKGDVLEKAEMGESLLDDTIEYGIQLGFIESGDSEELKATRRGQQYGYGDLPDDRENKLFQDAIRDYIVYSEFLEIAEAEIQEINDNPAIKRDGMTRELRIRYSFDVSDRVLESVANTFLKTLDAAGLGQHKTGRQGYPTRFEVGEAFHNFQAELMDNQESEPSEDQVAESEDKSVEQTDLEEVVSSQEEGEDESDEGVDGETTHQENMAVDRSRASKTVKNTSELADTATELNVEITISSSDWSNKEVIEVIRTIQEGENEE